LKFQHQNSEIFCPILLKNIKILNVYNFGNTGPITKIPTLLSSEAWDLSPYQILWILEKVRWKIPVFLDHLTWNDSLPLCEEVGIGNFAVESDSDILSMTLQPWVPGWNLEVGSWDATFDVITTTSDLMFSEVFLMFDVYAMNLMLKTIFMV